MWKLIAAHIPLAFPAIVALSALAGTFAPANAQEVHCIRASQCHGPLPHICRKCKDGGDRCAHWACVRHRCTISICSG